MTAQHGAVGGEASGSGFPESRFLVSKMDLKELAAKATMLAWKDEIERAIPNAKRTEWDKWFRREWYRAGEEGAATAASTSLAQFAKLHAAAARGEPPSTDSSASCQGVDP